MNFKQIEKYIKNINDGIEITEDIIDEIYSS